VGRRCSLDTTVVEEESMRSSEFDPDWFLNARWRDEGHYIDHKREIFSLATTHDRFQFVKSLIAFGNIARRVGRCCYIFFGVDNKTRDLCDVEANPCPVPSQSELWDEPGISISTKQIDGIQRMYRECADKYIAPCSPTFSLQYGCVEDSGKKIFVSYLKVEPTFTDEPFHLKRDLDKRQKGDVFIRCGDASLLVKPDQVKCLVSKSEVEYLSGKDWNWLIDYHKAGPFLEAAQSLQPAFECKDISTGAHARARILELLKQGDKVILVSALAGQGKTVVLHRVAYDLAEAATSSVVLREFAQTDKYTQSEDSLNDICELETTPRCPIPLFLPLRRRFTTQEEFNQLLLFVIKQQLDRRFQSLQAIFAMPGSKWIVLLDGIDEIPNREVAGQILQEWVNALPNNVQVVASSRPYALPEAAIGTKVSLAPLEKEEINRILSVLLKSTGEADIFKDVERFLANNPSLYDVLSRFRAIDGFVKFCRGEFYRPFLPPQDQQIVNAAATSVSPLAEQDNMELPTYRADDVVFSGNFLNGDSEDVLEKDEIEGNGIELSLASVMQSIVQYICEQEVTRHNFFGSDPKRKSEKAMYSLRKTSWNLDWGKEDFDVELCKSKKWLTATSRDWNEFIGFIVCRRYPSYSFYNPLFHFLTIAEYAYDLNEDKVLAKMQSYLKSQVVTNVLSFYNELRKDNGREMLQDLT